MRLGPLRAAHHDAEPDGEPFALPAPVSPTNRLGVCKSRVYATSRRNVIARTAPQFSRSVGELWWRKRSAFLDSTMVTAHSVHLMYPMGVSVFHDGRRRHHRNRGTLVATTDRTDPSSAGAVPYVSSAASCSAPSTGARGFTSRTTTRRTRMERSVRVLFLPALVAESTVSPDRLRAAHRAIRRHRADFSGADRACAHRHRGFEIGIFAGQISVEDFASTLSPELRYHFPKLFVDWQRKANTELTRFERLSAARIAQDSERE